MLEPHVIVKTAHPLKRFVAERTREKAARLHVEGAHVAARVVAVGEALAALPAPYSPLRPHYQLGPNGI